MNIQEDPGDARTQMYRRNSYWCIRRTFSNLRGIKTHDRQVIEIKEHLMKKKNNNCQDKTISLQTPQGLLKAEHGINLTR